MGWTTYHIPELQAARTACTKARISSIDSLVHSGLSVSEEPVSEYSNI